MHFLVKIVRIVKIRILNQKIKLGYIRIDGSFQDQPLNRTEITYTWESNENRKELISAYCRNQGGKAGRNIK